MELTHYKIMSLNNVWYNMEYIKIWKNLPLIISEFFTKMLFLRMVIF